MRLVIEDSQERVAHWVATYVRKRITNFQPTSERPFVLGLPTGSSPLLTYAKLIEFHRAGALSFEHVVTFNMDEYVNLPESHPESYHAFMWTNLFQHVDIRFGCVTVGGFTRICVTALTLYPQARECAHLERQRARPEERMRRGTPESLSF